jgi:squalene-hopene/tetraprenyl-beta-curcumene cyclase
MNACWLAAAIVCACAAADPGTADAHRQVLERAIGFMDGAGAELERGESCINCHHAPLRAWAVSEAAAAGLPVDAELLRATTEEQVSQLLELKDAYRAQQWGHSLASLFVIGATEAKSAALGGDTVGRLREIIVAEQAADGSWHPAQQFGNQRRPKRDANQAQTLWSLLALAGIEPDGQPSAAHRRAAEWLDATEPGTTIDVRALRLAAELRFGTPERSGELLAELIASQQADGGWGWQPDDASDAWATGMALYALDLAGAAAPAAAVQSARDFLASTQREDGSWLVEGRLTGNSDMSSYFGTAWAIIGLSRTLQRP